MMRRKEAGISVNDASYGMSVSLVAEGSPEQLSHMSSESLYERAVRLAKEAGIDI